MWTENILNCSDIKIQYLRIFFKITKCLEYQNVGTNFEVESNKWKFPILYIRKKLML